MAEVITLLNCDELPHLSHLKTATLEQSTDKKGNEMPRMNGEACLKTPTKHTSSLTKNFRTPRCEAFVMTGDKMLILNSKISPHYAKMRQEQLPPTVEVYEDNQDLKKRGLFDEFPSMHYPTSARTGRLTTNNSEIASVSKFQSANFIAFNESDVNETEEKDKEKQNLNNYSACTLPETISESVFDASCASTAHSSLGVGNGKTTPKPTFESRTTSQSSVLSPTKRSKVMSNESYDHEKIYFVKQDNSSLSNVTTSGFLALPKPEVIKRVATQLFTLQANYSLNDVAAFLMKKDCEFSCCVADTFLQFFNFSGKRLDVALRDFLNHVCLTGESSERAHLLMYFSTRYYECNPTLFNSIDEIHALACALILLNTDLHGFNVGKKMTAREFVENLLHTQYVYDRNMLKTLYNAVKETPFLRVVLSTFPFTSNIADSSSFLAHGTDCSLGDAPILLQNGQYLPKNGVNQGVGNLLRSSIKMRRLTLKKEASKNSMFVNPREQVDYKRGWVLKKSVYDSDGRKTPFGRRKWQMCYATLRGMVLYLHKNESVFEGSRHETFANCIRLHHAVAEIATDYVKRQHVFRLRTSNFGEFLFQTSEPQEVQRWIDAVNYVAAAYSTPPLPAPVSSADVNTPIMFFPPSLPTAPTTRSTVEQFRAYCDQLEEVTKALTKLRSVAPSIKAKGSTVYNYFYRERYLDKERERYLIYVSLLSDKLGAVSQLDIASVPSNIVKKHSLPGAKLHCYGSGTVQQIDQETSVIAKFNRLQNSKAYTLPISVKNGELKAFAKQENNCINHQTLLSKKSGLLGDSVSANQ